MASRRAPRLPLAGLRVVETAHHLAAPIAATPARLRVHAPALGRDSRRILAELGYPQTEIARLISDGVVRAAPK